MSFLKKVLFVIMGLSLSGCLAPVNIFNTASPIAAAESRLFQIILVMSLVVFLIVDGGLVFILIRNRSRGDDQTPPRQVYDNRLLEAIWTGIPILIVIVLFILTVATMRAVAAPARSANDVVVNVVGHRWWWEFDYPGLGIKTANELHMPVGTNVHLDLTSVDVIHSFWPPQLSGKFDAIPGQTNTMWLTSDVVGEYPGQCAEFCGLQHAHMGFTVVVESKEDFLAWASAQQQAAAQPEEALAQQGQKLVTGGICAGCHAIEGTNAKGMNGPNLTHLYSRKIFAGGVAPLTEENLAAWLRDSEAMKPGNLMANVRVQEQHLPAILAYLRTLK